MKSLTIHLPIFRTDEHGTQFVSYRKLSSSNYYRMMKKLHWNDFLERERLFYALLEKDVQRLKNLIYLYVESESKKYENAGVFVRIDTTVQELDRIDNILHYRVFMELFVGEIEKVS